MQTVREMDLVRAVPLRAELHAVEEDASQAMPEMVVRFAVFNEWYEISSFYEGTFLERVARGAFRKTMRESGHRVRVLFNHGMDPQIGDKALGMPGELREDEDAAVLVTRLFDTSYNRDLLPGLEAGAYGASFTFRVIRDEWVDEPSRSAHNPDGLPERTIKEVRLFEAGPVTWPANPAATSGVRSATDEFYERLVRSRDPQRYELIRSRVVEIRAPEADAAPAVDEGTLVEGVATDSTDASGLDGRHHPNGLSASRRERELILLSL